MAKILKLRRGNTAAHSTFVGKTGEITVDTQTNSIVVHDNVTPGGHRQATELYVNQTIANIPGANLEAYATVAYVNDSIANIPEANLTGYATTLYVDNAVANVVVGNVNFGNLLITNNSLTTVNTNENLVLDPNGAGEIVVYGNILPGANVTYNLGSPGAEWNSLYVSSNTIYIGGTALSIDDTGTLTVDGDPVTGSGPSQGYIQLTNEAAPLNIWAGPEVSFVKSNYGNEVDEIDANLSITRGENQGIYNSALEEGWDNQWGDPDGRTSPKGTVWNSDGWDDLTNLDQRSYNTFYNVMNGAIGNNVLGRLYIMKDVANDTYYKVDFIVWGNANSGAPVTYTRQQVNPIDGTDIGDLVTFEKAGYEDPFIVFDNVSAEVKIGRASNQSIFNIVSEQGYNGNWPGDGDGENSPQGTEWNIDGWDNLTDVKQRTYKSLLEIFDWNLGTRIVGTECVMHDTINNKYYAIKFTQWSGQSSGGGFAYTRRLINTDAVFIHTEDGNEVDDIAEGVGITRDYNGAIYNPYDEGSWVDEVSPGGTEWNFDGTEDLSNIENRVYRTFFEAIQFWGIGYKIEGKEAVMRVTSTGDYYTIKFLHWQQGGGGAFSYIRTPIDLTKVNEGIRFADGTVQKTAVNNRVKFKGPIGRRIEEYCGYEEVRISQAQEYVLDTTMRGTYNNTSYLQINVPNETTAVQINNNVMRNLSISFDNGTTWVPLSIQSGGYGQYPTNFWYAVVYTLDEYRVNYTNDQPVKLKYWRGGEPKIWFDPEKSLGGAGNFRGAIIDYHAYSDSDGTIIGQIMVSNDSSDYNVTHTESTSGSSDLTQLVLWHSSRSEDDYNSGEGKLYAYRVDGEDDTVKIQWKATMFYGAEFYD